MDRTSHCQAKGAIQMELPGMPRKRPQAANENQAGARSFAVTAPKRKLTRADVIRAADLDRQLANRSRGLTIADCYKRCGYSAEDETA